MKTSLRLITGLCLGGLLAFPLGLATGRGLFARNPEPNTAATSGLLRIEGFDFNAFRSKDNEWRGPDLGEKIDLARLRTKESKTLASVVGPRPFMLVAVNPTCAMCKIARDQMIYLRTELSRLNVDYYIVDSVIFRLALFRASANPSLVRPSSLGGRDAGLGTGASFEWWPWLTQSHSAFLLS